MILFILCVSPSYAAETITWYTVDFPPVIILHGPYKSKGSVDFMQQAVVEHLTEYEHQFVKANSKRVFAELSRTDKSGYAAALKTPEREMQFVYSIPYAIILPHGVIIRKKTANTFQQFLSEDGYFMLNEALSDQSLNLGISIGRSYGVEIDTILGDCKDQNNISVAYDNISKTLLWGLFYGNIDYILGYAIEAGYFLKASNIKEDVLTYPLAETSNYMLGYFVFPNTDWGRKIVVEVNKVLRMYRNSDEFHDVCKSWLDEMSAETYMEHVGSFYE